MDCVHIKRYLSVFVDGELKGEPLEAFQAHLRQCRACAKLVETQQGVLDLLHTYLSRVKAPSDFETKVRERIAAKG
jgi:anti-sigma factor (TIGR02949 family)